MLFAILPASVVCTAIFPKVDADSIFLIILELAHEDPAVAPFISAFSVHQVLTPIAEIHLVSLYDIEETFAGHDIVLPFANI